MPKKIGEKKLKSSHPTPQGGRNIIRRKGIMVYGHRYSVNIDKLEADQQILSSFYHPYPTVIID